MTIANLVIQGNKLNWDKTFAIIIINQLIHYINKWINEGLKNSWVT
jgi:hypothetical protein